jgi:hypothetical protein
MTDTSQVRLAVVREATPGTTPGSPRMRLASVGSVGLRHRPSLQQSALMRSDRMDADAEVAGEVNDGAVGIQFMFPRDLWPHSEWWQSLFCSAWVNTPQHDNDGTADSVITAVAGSGVYTVVDQSGSGGFSGAAYKVGHLVRASDFGVAANSGLSRVTASTSTSVTLSSVHITTSTEAAPPAAARLKVVGFQGASGDITATSTGLASTSLDFTTLGLAVGQWIKIGGAGGADVFRFGTTALNGWARITAIAANALTLDNRPTGWTTDSGTSKTIRVFFGDVLKNGTARFAVSMERGSMAQASPTYTLQAGMEATSAQLTMAAKQIVTGSFTFMGRSGLVSGTSVDSTPDPALDTDRYPVFTCSTNVGRVAEAGLALASPNFCRSMIWNWDNAGRMQDAIDVPGAVGIGRGRAGLTIDLETYFGDDTLYAKARAGTATSLSARLQKTASDGVTRAVVFGAPRLKLEGNPDAPGPDQDELIRFTARASRDPLTNCHYQMDRLEYVEA